MLGYKIIPATKVIMEQMGFKVGEASFPMKRYTAEQRSEIVESVRKAGLDI